MPGVQRFSAWHSTAYIVHFGFALEQHIQPYGLRENSGDDGLFGGDLNVVRKGDGSDFFPRKEALNELRANHLALHDERKHQLIAELVFSHKFFSCFRAARTLNYTKSVN